jgi:DNA-binding transcriptional MerR regulator
MSSKYSIKDLERLTGIKAHTLRIWEQRYEILQPKRTDTNIRYYNNDDVKRILNISLLNNNGYKISNIAKLSEPEIFNEAEKYLNNYKKESDQIDNLVLCLMEMNEDKFERTINTSVIKFGFENTFEKIIFPFMRHLGNMWQVGMLNPAQEHFISNLIRQKLIVGIDNIKTPISSDAKSFLFFLPSQELHEMGLLYTYYLTKMKGYKCAYLGQSVPVNDLADLADLIKPDFIVTILTANLPDSELNTFLKDCSEKINKPTFLVSGRLFFCSNEKVELPKKFKIFEDFQDFKKLI